jgi:hypothetical protein
MIGAYIQFFCWLLSRLRHVLRLSPHLDSSRTELLSPLLLMAALGDSPPRVHDGFDTREAPQDKQYESLWQFAQLKPTPARPKLVEQEMAISLGKSSTEHINLASRPIDSNAVDSRPLATVYVDVCNSSPSSTSRESTDGAWLDLPVHAQSISANTSMHQHKDAMTPTQAQARTSAPAPASSQPLPSRSMPSESRSKPPPRLQTPSQPPQHQNIVLDNSPDGTLVMSP